MSATGYVIGSYSEPGSYRHTIDPEFHPTDRLAGHHQFPGNLPDVQPVSVQNPYLHGFLQPRPWETFLQNLHGIYISGPISIDGVSHLTGVSGKNFY